MVDLKELYIEGTGKTPKIEFNNLTGDLILRGRSFPENAPNVYEPLLDWINEYVKAPQITTNLHLKLEYFNSSSLLWIVKIIKVLSKIDKPKSTLFIHLYFDNDDFDFKDTDELKDIICSVFDNIGRTDVTIGIKTHGTGDDGKVVDESTILI